MQLLMSAVGVLLAVGVMAVSAVVNARYGMSLARDGFDQQVMMAVAVFADVGKAVSWIFFAGALMRRDVLASLASLLIFAACLTYAVSGSLGYVAMNRAQSTATVESKSDNAIGIKTDLQRDEAARKALGMVEPAAVIGKQIEAKKQDRKYTLSKQCTEATAEASRAFCAELALLEADQLKAETAAKLDTKINTLRQRVETLGGVATADKGDFQGALIAQITNLKVSTIQLSLALLFVVMVESGACFLLWLSLNHGEQVWRSRRRQTITTMSDLPTAVATPVAPVSIDRPITPVPVARQLAAPVAAKSATRPTDQATPAQMSPGDLVAFVETGIDLSPGGRAEIGEIARAYKRWCMRNNLRAVSDELIMAGLERFCEVGGIVCEPREGKIYLKDVVITKAAGGDGKRQRTG